MAAQLLPLFPFSVVLPPAMPLPLHIFEPRYKEMFGDLREPSDEFGVVLAKDEGIVNIGCSARVEHVVNRYEDGRLDLIAIGARRFQIDSLDQSKSYLQAAVEFFDDENVADPASDLAARAQAAYRELLQLEEVEPPETRSARLSFQIGQLIRDLDKRQALLALRSESERLDFILKTLPEYIARQQRTLLAKRVAPQNGHAKGL